MKERQLFEPTRARAQDLSHSQINGQLAYLPCPVPLRRGAALIRSLVSRSLA